MPQNRFFLETLFQTGLTTQLSGDEAHHALKVMRKTQGSTLELVNGKNQLAQARIAKIEKHCLHLEILDVYEKPPSVFPIILCQAIPKLNRLDHIVEKGCELGMTELWLFPGQTSEKTTLTTNQLNRLDLLAISALKQCGRLDLPIISIKPSLAKWNSLPFPAYFGDTDPNAPSFHSIFHKENGILFFIGPEAGFSHNEIAILNQLGARGVKLHSNILRVDTASFAALSLIDSLCTLS